MLGDFASLDVQNTYRGSDAYESILKVFIVTGLLLAVHKKNELTLSKVKLFDKFQRRQKC
nr:hypothetical protein [Piscirickettsia salmonis]